MLQSMDQEMSRKYTDVLRTSFQSMDLAQNILVVKTVSGMAMAAAAALDEMQIPEIVGSIAGDNTLMCVARSVDEKPGTDGKDSKNDCIDIIFSNRM